MMNLLTPIGVIAIAIALIYVAVRTLTRTVADGDTHVSTEWLQSNHYTSGKSARLV
jgi:hypothetical protein